MGGNVRGSAAATAGAPMMSTRVQFRSRQLDVNKSLQIVRRLDDLDPDDAGASRGVTHGHENLDAENEEVKTVQGADKKGASTAFIPIPDSIDVATYNQDYPATHVTRHAYIRTRRQESDNYVEYDLDDEDEQWLEDFNGGFSLLTEEKFEAMLNALELAAGRAQEASLTGLPSSAVLDHSKVYVSKEAAFESMRRLQARHASCTAVYEYWLSKRRKLGMPLLRQFQPSVPLTDNDPYKVFRPRDKPTRPHTRRKRENDLPSYQRLYTVRQNLEAAARLFAMVHRRERCKREALDVAVELANARLMRAHGADAAAKADREAARREAERQYMAELRKRQEGDSQRYAASAARAQLGLPFTVAGKELLHRAGRDALMAAHGRTVDGGQAAAAAVAAAAAAGVGGDAPESGKRPRKKSKSDKARRPLRGMPSGAQLAQLRASLEPTMAFCAPPPAKTTLEASGVCSRLADSVPEDQLENAMVVPRIGRGGRVILDRCNVDGEPWTEENLGKAMKDAAINLAAFSSKGGAATGGASNGGAAAEKAKAGAADGAANGGKGKSGDVEMADAPAAKAGSGK